MSIQIQLRRGTALQHDTFTGANAELTVDTTNYALRLHDGSTAGGFEILRKDLSNLTNASISNSKLANSSVTINGQSVSLGGSTTITATASNALTIGTGLSGSLYDGSSAVTISLSNTGVTAGSYGSATAIPVLTINAQGQITAVTTASVATNLSIDGDAGSDTIDLLSDTLSFVGASGIATSVSGNTVTISGQTLTNSITSVASDISNETIARTSADTTLQNNINTEATTRAAADTTLTNNLNAEISRATSAESALGTRIDNLDVTDIANAASTSYVNTAISNLIDTAPAALDTLNELAAALGDDSNFASTVTTNLSTKADKSTIISAGVGLSGGGDLSANRTLSLSSSGVTAGSYGSGTSIPTITVDQYGRITNVTGNSVVFPTALSEFTNDVGYSTLSGTETLTNKTLSSPTISGSILYSSVGSNAVIDYKTGNVSTTFDVRVVASGGDGTQGNGNYNIISGTLTHNLVPLVTTSGTQSLTNKTLVSPTITGVSPTITLAGDLTGSVTLTDLANGTLNATIAANSVALGTDTIGNYASEVVAGSGIIVSGSAGEGTSFTISHADTSSVSNLSASNRTYVNSLTFDTFGHVTGYTTETESVVNTTYSISAETDVSGAKIRISGSDSSVDDVKLTAGSNINITRTDANTITIESTASSSKFLVYKRGDVAPSSATPIVISSGQLTVYGRTQNIGVLV
jgi:hypothetical protein